jgi:hypothetical protein
MHNSISKICSWITLRSAFGRREREKEREREREREIQFPCREIEQLLRDNQQPLCAEQVPRL